MLNINLRKEKKRDDKSQRNERFIEYACLYIRNLIFGQGVDVLKDNLVVELRVSGEMDKLVKWTAAKMTTWAD